MSLKQLIALYRTLVRNFGDPAAISAFALSLEEAQRLFSGFEEDYHIGRFFHFTESDGQRYSINGFPATHVAIDSEIESIL